MRKLKLQVQTSVDGYVGGPKGELDWMQWNWDDKLKKYVDELHDSIDTILMGRKMTEGFISHWTNVKPEDPEYTFARKMVEIPKVVFTKTLTESKWPNTRLVKGDLTDEVNNLKRQSGKDMIVYGGASFDSSLIRASLIDEFHLFVNPTALGNGLAIFKQLNDRQKLNLVKATPFECGIVVLQYEPK